jgi:hypothetical protein
MYHLSEFDAAMYYDVHKVDDAEPHHLVARIPTLPVTFGMSLSATSTSPDPASLETSLDVDRDVPNGTLSDQLGHLSIHDAPSPSIVTNVT